MHKAAIIIAILLSLIAAAPQIYLRIDPDNINTGIEVLPDSPWSARTREVQDGHPNFGAIYYKDGKDNPYLFQPLGSMVVGYMGKALSLDIADTILLSKFVLPFFTLLILYSFLYLFSRDKLLALAASALLLFADSILSKYGILQVLHGSSPDNFLRMARPVNPAVIYILFFGFLSAFWRYYKMPTLKWGVISAVVLGLNFYNYFWSWSYLFALGLLLALIHLIRREWSRLKNVLWVYLGGAVVAIPYMMNLYRASKHPQYLETGAINGVVHTHVPLFVGLVVIIALAVFVWKFPKDDRDRYFFGAAALLAPFITLNQQIITGKILQVNHYHWFFHKPMGVIFILIVLFYFLASQGLDKYRKVLAVGLIVVSISTAVFVQADSYLHDEREGGQILVDRQRYGEVVDWLNNKTEKESVVLGSDEAAHMVVIYTSNNVFYHRAGMYSLASTRARLLDQLFTFYRLEGVDVRAARERFYADRGHISAKIYGMYYRDLGGSYETIPNEKIEEILEAYLRELRMPISAWLRGVLDKYEVEYIVWDKVAEPNWRLDRFDFLEIKEDFGRMAIYGVK